MSLLVAPLAVANEQAMEALRTATGSWGGELYYFDYQSGERISIPMQAMIETTPDGATVIRRMVWTDPDKFVHAIVLTTIDRDTGELVEAFFRDGKGEYTRYELASMEFDSATEWTIEFEHDGTDDDRPARIRHTTQRDGDQMTSVKSVRFLDDAGGDYFERNGSELRLIEVAE